MRKYLKLFLICVIFLSSAVILSSRVFAQSKQEAYELRDKGLKAQYEGKIDEAMRYFSQARDLWPTWAVIYNDLGTVYEANYKFNEAEAMYMKAMSLDPSYPATYTNLAIFYESRQDFKNAIFYWKKRVRLGPPDSIWVVKAKNRLRMLGYKGKEAQATPVLKQDTLKYQPNNDFRNAPGREQESFKYGRQIDTTEGDLKEFIDNGATSDIQERAKMALLCRENGFNLLSQEELEGVRELSESISAEPAE